MRSTSTSTSTSSSTSPRAISSPSSVLDAVLAQLQVEDFSDLPPLPPSLNEPRRCAHTTGSGRLKEKRAHVHAHRPFLQRQRAVLCVQDLDLIDETTDNVRHFQRTSSLSSRVLFRRASTGTGIDHSVSLSVPPSLRSLRSCIFSDRTPPSPEAP